MDDHGRVNASKLVIHTRFQSFTHHTRHIILRGDPFADRITNGDAAGRDLLEGVGFMKLCEKHKGERPTVVTFR